MRRSQGRASSDPSSTLPHPHPLAGARGTDKRFLLTISGRKPILLRGNGAGGQATSLSVFADLLDVVPENRRPPSDSTPELEARR